MKTLVYSILFALIVTNTTAYAEGQPPLLLVLQKGTGEPVEGATVVNLETKDYATTDAKGEVVLKGAAKGSQVKVLAPGYETLVTKLDPINDKIKIYLVPLIVEGEGMEVVAERLPDKISKIALTEQELTHTPGSQGDPIIAAQTLPGIVAVSDSGGQVYMRGSDSSDNITVVNRLPIGYLYHLGGLRSTVNPGLISDLNIFLGGFPVTYGDSLGGVFDVRLRDPETRRRRYSFDISTIEASFAAEGPVSLTKPKDSYFVAARRSYYDLLFSPAKFTDLTTKGNKPDSERNQFITVPHYYDAQGVYHHPTNNGSLDYYYFASADKVAFEKRSGVQSDPQSAGTLETEQGFQTLGMSWKANLNPYWNIDMPLALYYQERKLRFGTDDAGNPFYANNQQYTLTWLPELTWKYNQQNEINFGLEGDIFNIPLDLYISRPPLSQDDNFLITDLPKYRINDTIHAYSASPYVQQRKHWTDKLTTIAGVRYSYIKGTGGIQENDVSPRLGVEYQATPKTLYTASWGRYLQLPQGFELLDGFGNPDLSYTEAEHRIIGVEHKISSLWSVKAEAYQKPMKDLVIAVDTAAPPDNYKNIGTGKAYGMDIFLKREPRNGRMGWLSYSYSRSTRYNPLKPQNGDSNFNGDQPQTLTYVWSQPFSDGPFHWMESMKRWTWGIKFQAHSGKVYTPVLGYNTTTNPDGSTRYLPIYGEKNSRRTPPYYRLDLRVERDILRNESKMKFYIEILNATNHKNITGYDYGERYQHINNPTELTGMPFFPYFGFQMEF